MWTLVHDLRYGARLLRKSPGFAAVALLSLALGIGANTAIFQLLDAVRLRTLPVKNPQELAEVRIANQTWSAGRFNGRYPNLTNVLWELIRDHQQAFSGMLAWSTDRFNLAVGGEGRYAQAFWVSGDFFRVLGVQPVLGRLFTPADDRRGCGSPGLVISYPFWQREFGAESSVIGRKITLEGHHFEIIGVASASFFGVEVGRSFDVAVPICAEPIIRGEATQLDSRIGWWLAVMGRLKPDWSLAQTSAHLNSISPGFFQETVPSRYDAEDAKRYLEYRLGAFPAGIGVSSLRQDYETPLRLLLAIAGLVLLITCPNLANLMLARASAREREFAVRLALGASSGRLIRQLLAESLLVAAIGALLGAYLARSLSQFLVSFLSTQGNPLFVDLDLDWRVLAFTTGLTILTCLLFGLAPAVRATRTASGAAMKASGRGMTASRERFGLQRILVVSQVALSLTLLVGALLFVRSLRNLLTLDAGFRQDGILITHVDLTRLNLSPEPRLDLKRDLVGRIKTIPGVDSAAATDMTPATGSWSRVDVMEEQQKKGIVNIAQVSPGYFKTMETPLLAGRDFDGRDTSRSTKVAIVNEAFVRKFLNGANPIGRTFRLEAGPGKPQPVYQIVGLVKNTKYEDLREEFQPISFLPAFQEEHADPLTQIFIHSNLPLTTLVAAVKGAVVELNPAIVVDFHVLKTQIREGLLRERLMATLSGFFGLLAVLLATIGLYGVMSYIVVRRTNEIGIRMALGANSGDVMTMILAEAVLLLVVGVAVGAVLSLTAAWAANSLLFGLRPYDPVTLLMAVALLAAVALAASYLPAHRAARLDPMSALREE